MLRLTASKDSGTITVFSMRSVGFKKEIMDSCGDVIGCFNQAEGHIVWNELKKKLHDEFPDYLIKEVCE